MKKLWIAALALLLAGCSAQQPPVETEPTAPPEKTVFVHSSITRTVGETSSRTEYLYDEQELLTDVVIYDGAEQEIQRYLVTCDENGNPVRWDTAGDAAISYTYDDKGRTLGTYTYNADTLVSSTEYNWSGELRVSVTVKTPAREQRTEYSYDDKGSLTRQDLYLDGQPGGWGLYTAGEDGKTALCESFDPEGNLFNRVSYLYEGSQETRTTTDADGTVTQTQILTYDESGNLLTNQVYDASGSLTSSETHVWKEIRVPAEQPRAVI